MKAVVLHQYGGPNELKLEDWQDPTPGDGEVLVRVSAASINPIDYKMRSGAMQQMFPVEFPAILGFDLSGTVRAVGAGVTTFVPGDKVFGRATQAYAELCVVKAAQLAKVPDGLDLVKAAALPLVLDTGEQLIRIGTNIQAGQTVLITGAMGGVGRSAVWTAKQAGANVIAGVRGKQLAEAKTIGADQLIALDDKDAMAKLGLLDAVADTVGGETGNQLLAHIKPGGVLGTVVGPPSDAGLHPTIRIGAVGAQPNPERMVEMARAVLAGKLKIPIDRMIPLAEASEGQAAAEKGGIGKVLLLA
jgi:NADPH:quinone reductase-like Zn-dependent oxidoreductase